MSGHWIRLQAVTPCFIFTGTSESIADLVDFVDKDYIHAIFGPPYDSVTIVMDAGERVSMSVGDVLTREPTGRYVVWPMDLFKRYHTLYATLPERFKANAETHSHRHGPESAGGGVDAATADG